MRPRFLLFTILVVSLLSTLAVFSPVLLISVQVNLANRLVVHSAISSSFRLDQLWEGGVEVTRPASSRELSTARNLLEKAAIVQPRARYSLAWTALLSGDHASATTRLERYLDEYPSDQMVNNMLGVLHWLDGDHKRASTYFSKSGSSPDYLLQVAGRYLAASERLSLIGQHSSANEMSQKAREVAWVAIEIMQQHLDPSDAQAQYRLGRALSRFWRGKSDLNAALDAFEQALRLRPNYYLYYQAAGMAAYAKGDYSTARSFLTRAVALSPTDTQSYYYLGMSSFQDGNYADAARYFEQAIQHGMLGATVFNHLGDTYVKLGDLQRAKHSYEMALRYDPNDEYAIRQLGKSK